MFGWVFAPFHLRRIYWHPSFRVLRCLHEVRERQLRTILPFLRICSTWLCNIANVKCAAFPKENHGKPIETAPGELLHCHHTTRLLEVLKVLEDDVSKLNPESNSMVRGGRN